MPLTSFTLPDGRLLDVSIVGRDGGLPFVWHHDVPGSGEPSPLLEREVLRRGFRLVTYSRPGYGNSTRLQDRSVAQVAQDVTALLTSIGAERFMTGGFGAGGPFALATAAIVPGVVGAISVAGLGPYISGESLDFFGGMDVEGIQEYGAARNGAEALRAYLGGRRPVMEQDDPDDPISSVAAARSAIDRDAVRDEFGEDASAALRAALLHGVEGWLDDDAALVADWHFDPREIPAPVHVWQGGQDRATPPSHGEWLADELPTAVPHLLPDEDHRSIVGGRLGEMVDALTESAR